MNFKSRNTDRCMTHEPCTKAHERYSEKDTSRPLILIFSTVLIIFPRYDWPLERAEQNLETIKQGNELKPGQLRAARKTADSMLVLEVIENLLKVDIGKKKKKKGKTK